ncbi:MAG: hypothetical protein WCI47_00840 [bacterium]
MANLGYLKGLPMSNFNAIVYKSANSADTSTRTYRKAKMAYQTSKENMMRDISKVVHGSKGSARRLLEAQVTLCQDWPAIFIVEHPNDTVELAKTVVIEMRAKIKHPTRTSIDMLSKTQYQGYRNLVVAICKRQQTLKARGESLTGFDELMRLMAEIPYLNDFLHQLEADILADQLDPIDAVA